MTPSLDATLSSVMTSLNNKPKPPESPEPKTKPPCDDSKLLASRLGTKCCPEFRAKVLRMNEASPGAFRLAKFTEAWIKAAAQNKRDRGTWMVLAGPPGVGKTHALKAARRFLENHSVDLWHECFWRNPPSILWATWSRVVALDKDEWEDWIYDLRRANIVILDDVGSEVDKYKTGEPAERLRVALDISEHRWMLMSTNLMPDQWATAFDRRVQSRLQPAVVLDMTGFNDFRPTKNLTA